MEQKRTKFSIISNFIFTESILILITYIWSNFYLKNIVLSFFIAIIITIAINLLYLPLKIKYNTKQKTKRKEQTIKDNFKRCLQLGKRKDVNNYLLNKFEFKSIKKLAYNHYHCKLNDCDIYIIPNKIEFNEFSIYNDSISKNIKILTIDEIKLSFKVQNYNIEIISFENIYNICKEDFDSFIPAINLDNTKFKITFKDFLPLIFSKNNYKKFFTLGILLILSSMITQYKVYYLMFSSLLLILSLYCKFNKKYNK